MHAENYKFISCVCNFPWNQSFSTRRSSKNVSSYNISVRWLQILINKCSLMRRFHIEFIKGFRWNHVEVFSQENKKKKKFYLQMIKQNESLNLQIKKKKKRRRDEFDVEIWKKKSTKSKHRVLRTNSTPGIMEILPGKININSEDFKSRRKKKYSKSTLFTNN